MASVRRLAAIMFTDMVGYTSLSQRKESLALELLDEHRRLVRPLFRKYGGTEVKTMGDAFLVEFASALEAARCAFEIQQSFSELNDNRSGERQIRLRIGLHLGDVIHRDNDVYGDAVNVASRIQHLAEPGGICLSQQVHDHIRNKLELPVISLGPHELRNVDAPLEVYKIVLPWELEPSASSQVCIECFVHGLIRAGIVLVEGPSGVGKSSLLRGLARLAVENEQPIIFASTGPPTAEIAEQVKSWGAPPEKVRVIDCYRPGTDSPAAQLETPRLDLGRVRREIATGINELENPYLLFDSLDPFAIELGEDAAYNFLVAACRLCKSKSISGCATLTSGIHSPRFLSMARTAFAGTIQLHLEESGTGIRRMLRVQSIKGATHPTDLFPYEIRGDGILIGAPEYRLKLPPRHEDPHFLKLADSR